MENENTTVDSSSNVQEQQLCLFQISESNGTVNYIFETFN